jgi:hypothetical protein
VRRETAGAYLKAAGIGVRPPGAWGRRPPAKPANENGVTTGSDAAKPANAVSPNPNPENLSTKGKAKARTAKPANENAVTTGFGVELSDSEHESPPLVPSTSLCEPFREAIELGLSQGRNAIGIWQDLVSESGFNGGYQTVKRFVRKLRGNQPPQPRAVIITAPGEESQVDYGPGPMVRDPQTGKYRRTRDFGKGFAYPRLEEGRRHFVRNETYSTSTLQLKSGDRSILDHSGTGMRAKSPEVSRCCNQVFQAPDSGRLLCARDQQNVHADDRQIQ